MILAYKINIAMRKIFDFHYSGAFMELQLGLDRNHPPILTYAQIKLQDIISFPLWGKLEDILHLFF